MKRGVGFALLAAVLLALPSKANALADTGDLDGHFGLGFQVGSPFALTGKYFLAKDHAIQGYLGVFDHGFDVVGADYVFVLGRVRPHASPVHFSFHIGAGALLGFGHGNCFDGFGDNFCNFNNGNEHLALGVRMPLAANMYFDKVPIEIFLELSPVLELIPNLDGGFMLGLGGRFYF